MTKISSFDWSQLDRQTIFDIVYTLYDRIVYKQLTVDQLHSKVIRRLKTYFPIKANKKFDSKVQKSWVYVGGAYYSDYDKDREKSIEIGLYYNPKDKYITMTPRRFARFCTGIADTLLHEIIHMRQFRRRNFKFLPGYQSTASRAKKREEQEYLGDNDELDAYSFNIACELNERFSGHQSHIINYLNASQKGFMPKYNTWRMYLQTFGHDHKHPVLRRVKKRVVYYLPKAAQGKPFRPSEWVPR